MKKMAQGTLDEENNKLEALSEEQLDSLEWARDFMKNHERRMKTLERKREKWHANEIKYGPVKPIEITMEGMDVEV